MGSLKDRVLDGGGVLMNAYQIGCEDLVGGFYFSWGRYDGRGLVLCW